VASVARTWPWCPCRCPDRRQQRRGAAAAGEQHSAVKQKKRVNITSFIYTEGRFLRRRGPVAAGEEHSANEQKRRLRGDASSKNWRLGRRFASQAHVLVFFAPFAPFAPAAQSLGVASGVDAPLSICSFDDTLSSSLGHYTNVVATYGHSEQARAPHTNGPRDVPKCTATLCDHYFTPR